MKNNVTKTVESFWATIYVGFQERYEGVLHTIDEAEKICQDYCDSIGLCVTVTPTMYIYTRGKELGCAIGLINYPRFPSSESEIIIEALELASRFLIQFNQYKVTVVTKNETFMLENDIE